MLSNTYTIIAVILVVPLAVLAGCAQSRDAGPLSGTLAGYPEEPVMAPLGPQSMIVESEGQTVPLASLYNDATILVFLEQSCLDPNSDVVRAASEPGATSRSSRSPRRRLTAAPTTNVCGPAARTSAASSRSVIPRTCSATGTRSATMRGLS